MDDLRIDPKEAATKVTAGDAVLLDVVTTAAWESLSKVPRGALRIPPEEIADRLDEIPAGREVIAFCT
jgi:rhodanese-related sulfurtransferase